MIKWSTAGAIAGYLVVCLIYGKQLPVMSLPVIIAVVTGTALGPLIGPLIRLVLAAFAPTADTHVNLDQLGRSDVPNSSICRICGTHLRETKKDKRWGVCKACRRQLSRE